MLKAHWKRKIGISAGKKGNYTIEKISFKNDLKYLKTVNIDKIIFFILKSDLWFTMNIETPIWNENSRVYVFGHLKNRLSENFDWDTFENSFEIITKSHFEIQTRCSRLTILFIPKSISKSLFAKNFQHCLRVLQQIHDFDCCSGICFGHAKSSQNCPVLWIETKLFRIGELNISR